MPGRGSKWDDVYGMDLLDIQEVKQEVTGIEWCIMVRPLEELFNDSSETTRVWTICSHELFQVPDLFIFPTGQKENFSEIVNGEKTNEIVGVAHIRSLNDLRDIKDVDPRDRKSNLVVKATRNGNKYHFKICYSKAVHNFALEVNPSLKHHVGWTMQREKMVMLNDRDSLILALRRSKGDHLEARPNCTMCATPPMSLFVHKCGHGLIHLCSVCERVEGNFAWKKCQMSQCQEEDMIKLYVYDSHCTVDHCMKRSWGMLPCRCLTCRPEGDPPRDCPLCGRHVEEMIRIPGN